MGSQARVLLTSTDAERRAVSEAFRARYDMGLADAVASAGIGAPKPRHPRNFAVPEGGGRLVSMVSKTVPHMLSQALDIKTMVDTKSGRPFVS